VKLRLTNLDTTGRKVVTLWSFDPLFDNSKRPDFSYVRRSGRGANAKFISKPLARQRAIRVTFGADCLIDNTNWESFKKFLDAHKIELSEIVNAKEIFTEFTIEAEDKISLDHLEDHAYLVFKEFILNEANASWYNKWYKS
jgi:hypothetical protein